MKNKKKFLLTMLFNDIVYLYILRDVIFKFNRVSFIWKCFALLLREMAIRN